jgi:hypothetical protein
MTGLKNIENFSLFDSDCDSVDHESLDYKAARGGSLGKKIAQMSLVIIHHMQ